MRTVKYDASIINTYARQLYDRAFVVIATHIVVAAAIAATAVFVAQTFTNAGPQTSDVLLFAAGAGLLGFLIGRQRAFWLRLQAQTALCQAQIEANTRNLAYVMATPVSPPVVTAPIATVAMLESTQAGPS
jgi:hypothetical protein